MSCSISYSPTRTFTLFSILTNIGYSLFASSVAVDLEREKETMVSLLLSSLNHTAYNLNSTFQNFCHHLLEAGSLLLKTGEAYLYLRNF